MVSPWILHHGAMGEGNRFTLEIFTATIGDLTPLVAQNGIVRLYVCGTSVPPLHLFTHPAEMCVRIIACTGVLKLLPGSMNLVKQSLLDIY